MYRSIATNKNSAGGGGGSLCKRAVAMRRGTGGHLPRGPDLTKAPGHQGCNLGGQNALRT